MLWQIPNLLHPILSLPIPGVENVWISPSGDKFGGRKYDFPAYIPPVFPAPVSCRGGEKTNPFN